MRVILVHLPKHSPSSVPEFPFPNPFNSSISPSTSSGFPTIHEAHPCLPLLWPGQLLGSFVQAREQTAHDPYDTGTACTASDVTSLSIVTCVTNFIRPCSCSVAKHRYGAFSFLVPYYTNKSMHSVLRNTINMFLKCNLSCEHFN